MLCIQGIVQGHRLRRPGVGIKTQDVQAQIEREEVIVVTETQTRNPVTTTLTLKIL